MVIPLKQSTASQEIFLGKFVDSTDGNTQETALTINSVDIFIWKHGATARVNPLVGATHMSQGDYYFVADATDSNTLGGLILSCHPTGALAVKQECVVYPAQVFDSLFSTDLLQVDVREKGDSALDLTTTEKASVNTEVDSALNTAIPASNTATSVNDVLLDVLTLSAINAEVDTALNTAIPGTNTADSVNDILLDTLGTDVWATGTKALTDKAGFSLAADQSAVTVGTVTTLTNWSKTGYALSTAGIDAILDDVIEGTLTLRQATTLIHAACAGKSSGGGTATLIFRDSADAKNRITATVDADGNRTAVVTDVT